MGVAVRVDFLAIAFSEGSKRVVRNLSDVYFFKTGEVALYELTPMDDYYGWAFVFRSIESGEILGSAASAKPLEPYAEAYIKSKGGVSKEPTAEIRKMILTAISEN
jgi:hypothetical protein